LFRHGVRRECVACRRLQLRLRSHGIRPESEFRLTLAAAAGRFGDVAQRMHEPVLLEEVLRHLAVKPGGTYIDGTVGSGAHALALLREMGPKGRLLGIDRDEEAVRRTERRLSEWGAKHGGDVLIVCASFADIADVARDSGFTRVDGVLLDLGISSDQIEAPDRGFSFRHEGRLDMRMSRSQQTTASDLVNRLDEAELESLIREYGEERQARRIAKAIVRRRRVAPIRTTRELSELVERAVGRRGRIHPATRTFMALRIAVNDELAALERGLAGAVKVLNVGGRLGVISFHSLEDRIVKHFFREHAGRWESLAAGGQVWRGAEPPVRLVNRRPVCPSNAEQERNARSRSAKLRVAERVSEPANGQRRT